MFVAVTMYIPLSGKSNTSAAAVIHNPLKNTLSKQAYLHEHGHECADPVRSGRGYAADNKHLGP